VTELADDRLELELRTLGGWLDRIDAPSPPAALVERTLRLASAELLRPPALAPGVDAAQRRLPSGFRRELARLVLTTLPALVLVLCWAALLLREGPAWLSAWLPADLAFALVVAHVAGGLGWLGLGCASLPLVAHRRARLRLGGANA
jgi:hypothetical protein